MEQHSKSVSQVADKVCLFYRHQQPYHIYPGSTNSTRSSSKTRTNTIDASKLNRVLHVDRGRHVVLVEPNVGMDRLLPPPSRMA